MEDLIGKLSEAYRQAGGRALLVGGTVRDRLAKRVVTDYDLEVFGLPAEKIITIAKSFGVVKEIGKSFGIVQLQTASGVIDIAAPRRETKTAAGHRGFSVEVDPSLTPEMAARRRDFTINAIAEDPLTGELIDPFGGQKDLQEKILRVVDPVTFVEDPLRVWRAVQLVGRFELTVDLNTETLLRQLAQQHHELPAQRKQAEWKKLFLFAVRPSLGVDLAQRIGLFADVPALLALPNTPQEPASHPEGSAWAHTLLVVDQAAKLSDLYHLDPADRLVVLLGAFLHDIGKGIVPTPTGYADATTGHAEVGAPLAQTWLEQNGFGRKIISLVVPLVRKHMDLYFMEKAWPAVTSGHLRRLVNELWPAQPLHMLTVREADFRGRGGDYPSREFAARQWLPQRLAELGLSVGPRPVIRGEDLLALGWTAGPAFSQVINAAEKYAQYSSADRQMILDRLRQADTPADALVLLSTPNP